MGVHMTTSRILSYGALGLPLAFAALPIYVHVPRFYAETAGMELAVLGTILLGARLLDAGIDPWLGWLADRLPRRADAGRRPAALRPRLRRPAQSAGARGRVVAARLAGPDLPRFFGGDGRLSGLGRRYRWSIRPCVPG